MPTVVRSLPSAAWWLDTSVTTGATSLRAAIAVVLPEFGGPVKTILYSIAMVRFPIACADVGACRRARSAPAGWRRRAPAHPPVARARPGRPAARPKAFLRAPGARVGRAARA